MAKHQFNLRRFLRNALLIIILVGGGIFAWEELLEDRLIAKNFATVEDGRLYRAGALSPAALRRVAESNDIKTIIDFGGYDKDPETFEAIRKVDAELGLRRIQLPLNGDATGDPNMYVEALRLLRDESNYPVLTHCAAGSERTGMCVLLHRVLEEDWSVEQAYRETRSYGHNPDDNWRFMMYFGTWRDEIEHALETGEPIPFVPGAGPQTRPETDVAPASPPTEG
ncbi:MAG: tyrosine-protein phosphatase [Planctomycetota bacterium]